MPQPPALARVRARPDQFAQHERHKASGMGHEWRQRHTEDAAAVTAKRETEHARGHISLPSTRGTRPAKWDMTGSSGTRRMPRPPAPSASPSPREATSTRPAREAHGQRDGTRTGGGSTPGCRNHHSPREPRHARSHVNSPSTQGTRPAGWDMNRRGSTRETPQQSQPSTSQSTCGHENTRTAHEHEVMERCGLYHGSSTAICTSHTGSGGAACGTGSPIVAKDGR